MHRVGSAGNAAGSTRPKKEKRFTYLLNDADNKKVSAAL
jgi:WD repeat-containing protein 48